MLFGKRVITLIALFCGVSVCAGCGTVNRAYASEGSRTADTTRITNPMIGYESAEAVNDTIGVMLTLPEVTQNKSFYVIGGEIAECQFFVGENKYCLRATKKSGNFIGVYDTEIPSDMQVSIDGQLDGIGSYKSGGHYSKWTKGDVHYSLITLMDVADEVFTEAFYACAGGKQ